MLSIKCPGCGNPMDFRWVENEIKRLRVVRRFLARVRKGNDCWEWTGLKLGNYGIISINRRNVGAHRYSYMLHVGEIPDGLWVLHKCDNTMCVNPEHLFLGTHQDNMDDKVAKGRQSRGGWSSPGESNPAAKVDRDTVSRIRKDRERGMNYTMLGQKYGIGKSQAWNICNGKSWTD
jgi:hypothetical protein